MVQVFSSSPSPFEINIFQSNSETSLLYVCHGKATDVALPDSVLVVQCAVIGISDDTNKGTCFNHSCFDMVNLIAVLFRSLFNCLMLMQIDVAIK